MPLVCLAVRSKGSHKRERNTCHKDGGDKKFCVKNSIFHSTLQRSIYSFVTKRLSSFPPSQSFQMAFFKSLSSVYFPKTVIVLFLQLLLKFHLCTDDLDLEARFAELAAEFHKAAEDKMKVGKKMC